VRLDLVLAAFLFFVFCAVVWRWNKVYRNYNRWSP